MNELCCENNNVSGILSLALRTGLFSYFQDGSNVLPFAKSIKGVGYPLEDTFWQQVIRERRSTRSNKKREINKLKEKVRMDLEWLPSVKSLHQTCREGKGFKRERERESTRRVGGEQGNYLVRTWGFFAPACDCTFSALGGKAGTYGQIVCVVLHIGWARRGCINFLESSDSSLNQSLCTLTSHYHLIVLLSFWCKEPTDPREGLWLHFLIMYKWYYQSLSAVSWPSQLRLNLCCVRVASVK